MRKEDAICKVTEVYGIYGPSYSRMDLVKFVEDSL